MWGALSRWGQRNQATLGIGIATAKTAAADWIVQKYVEKKDKLDVRRTALFTAFGFSYLGCFQYYMYVRCFQRWFPNAGTFANQAWREKLRNIPGQIDVVKQIGFDNFVHPIWFFPTYYIMKEVIQGEASTSPSNTVRNAMTKYSKHAWEDWTAFWKVWIVGDALVYAVPMWLRLPTNHTLSLGYVCILSFMRGGDDTKASDNSNPENEPEPPLALIGSNKPETPHSEDGSRAQ